MKKRKGQRGRGVWEDIKGYAKGADDWLKKTKILSTVLGGVGAVTPFLGLPEVAPIALGAKGLVGSLGYGKRRRRRSVIKV